MVNEALHSEACLHGLLPVTDLLWTDATCSSVSKHLISSLTCEFASDGQGVSSVVSLIREATHGQGKLVAASCKLLCLTATMCRV